ncbi:hypothetical protein [Sinorhizobium meliloti]|uniref:hypothetical protein n=1 Tax=Rhizobium meliloti TaxID=382 RepID=UPI0020908412|nr:hypothetical protein [Sinorhizobium meliloti]MCO5965421.1 hypothetical protein [Sinorhizobium meliloti]
MSTLSQPLFANEGLSRPHRAAAFDEIKDLGQSAGYTALHDFLRQSASERGFEVRFETPLSDQAQVDFAQFMSSSPINRQASHDARPRPSQLGALRHVSEPADRAALPLAAFEATAIAFFSFATSIPTKASL